MEGLIIFMIAFTAVVIAMSVILWRKYRENLVPMPPPVAGEDLNPLSAEEVEMLRKLAADFVSYVVLNREEQISLTEKLSAWKEGDNVRKLIKDLAARLKKLSSFNIARAKIEIRALAEACKDVPQKGRVERAVVGRLIVYRAAVSCLKNELAEC